jgi:hypothetical protein
LTSYDNHGNLLESCIFFKAFFNWKYIKIKIFYKNFKKQKLINKYLGPPTKALKDHIANNRSNKKKMKKKRNNVHTQSQIKGIVFNEIPLNIQNIQFNGLNHI